MALSERLSLIASLVPSGARVCDIGTDHGYLAIELMASGKASSVIAADIGEKPLLNARKNILASGLLGITLRRCDGFSAIEPEEFDTAVIAGMGGEVISGILERDIKKLSHKNKTLLLCPTTSPEFLRKFLSNNGFTVTEEYPVFENRKLYSVMKTVWTGVPTAMEEAFFYLGKISPKTEAGRLYIKKQQERCFKCMSALKENPQEKERYEYYRNLFEGISRYLDNN